MSVTIFHNPGCTTSRNVLALLQERGLEPIVVEYLKTGWDEPTLRRLAEATGGVRGLLRKREARAAELLASDASDAAIIAAMISQPILVERPIVETPKGARIARRADRALEVL